jgi:hypothetical protein
MRPKTKNPKNPRIILKKAAMGEGGFYEGRHYKKFLSPHNGRDCLMIIYYRHKRQKHGEKLLSGEL